MALYALAFEPLYGVVAREAVAFAILPVIIAGTLLGRSGGLIAGAASIPLNVLLVSQVTTEDPLAVLNNPAEMVQVLLIGLLTGLLGEWFGRLREQAEELRIAHEALQALVRSSPEAIIALDTAGTVTQWNAAAEQMFGWTEAEVMGSPLPFIPAEKQTEHRALRERVLRGEGFTDVEVVRFRKDGAPIRISVSTAPLRDKGGRVRGVISINQNITERKRAEEALQARVRQQAAVAWLGQLALGGLDLPELMGEATQLLADTLEVELTEVMELLPGGRELVLRAGQGWDAGNVAKTVIDAFDTQAGYTLQIAEPVVVEDLRTELRFSGSPLLHRHGVISGMSVLIFARGRPFGVLAVHSVVPHSFSEDDVNFLHAVANVLAQVIERTRADEALRESEERFRQLVESADDIIYRADANGFFTYANPVAVRSMGYTEDQLLGMHFLDLIRPDFHEQTTAFYTKQFHEKIPNTYWEFPAITRDGRELWLGQNVQLVREEGMLGVQAVARDITAKREIERIKDEFVSVVSHELRTPLTSIRGSLGLLGSGRMGELSPQGERLLTIAVQNTDRLVRLINDILDLERMQSGRATLEKRVCSAAELMTQAMETVSSAAEAAGVRLRVEASTELLRADPDRIVQVLVNLLGNAIKFSPTDTEVQLDAERRAEKLWFRVRDQGRGIPPDKIDSIFGRFQQVDSSDSREKGGNRTGAGDLPQHRRAARGTDLGTQHSRRREYLRVHPADRWNGATRRSAAEWNPAGADRRRRRGPGAGTDRDAGAPRPVGAGRPYGARYGSARRASPPRPAAAGRAPPRWGRVCGGRALPGASRLGAAPHRDLFGA